MNLPTKPSLTGRVAIVTGAGNPDGIGRATALSMACSGASVAVTDIPGSEGLKRVAAEIAGLGVRSLALECDNTSTSDINLCVQTVNDELQGVDILVNNAGISASPTPFTAIEDRHWDLNYQVNLRGTAAYCRAVLPLMLARGGGVIVNNASLCGLGAIETIPANYTATKFAVIGLTKALALEYSARNIRCNAVCPGVVNTGMRKNAIRRIAEQHEVSFEQAEAMEDASIAIKRPASPEEIAEAIVFLASPAASYITGVALPVAGGMAAGL